MREANVFRKNRAFYSGVILTVVEGLLSGCSYLSIYMVLSGLSEGSLSAQRLGLLTAFLAGIFLIRLVHLRRRLHAGSAGRSCCFQRSAASAG